MKLHPVEVVYAPLEKLTEINVSVVEYNLPCRWKMERKN